MAGGVDDGKSTLIGRLRYETKDLIKDKPVRVINRCFRLWDLREKILLSPRQISLR